MTAVGYQHYLDVASARDVPTFKRRIGEFAQRLDFPLFNATLVVEQPAARPFIVDLRNTPEAWTSSSTDGDSVTESLTLIAGKSRRPSATTPAFPWCCT